MPDEEGYRVSLREVHEDMQNRFDRLEESVSKPLAQLEVRVEHLEEKDARKFSLYGPWVGAFAAMIVGLIDFFK
jgi:hypothetical protein